MSASQKKTTKYQTGTYIKTGDRVTQSRLVQRENTHSVECVKLNGV